MNKCIDIIIPVYNGYDDIIACMQSIKVHTDLSVHRVILVNDASPDERILPLLKSYVSDHIVLIDSEKNGGFSASVNKGIAYSAQNDVILLNSDTIVTKGWIEKLLRCAYSRPEIGTVTPMSNAATLCSYPVFCRDNKIPEGQTVDSLAEVVERCSFRRYPQITVAVGFCMFIKREVLDQVGVFDAKTFERGYGEENDFCNRAEQCGYVQVMCDDTFIYHKGTGSFDTEEKKKLCEAHERILLERYPALMQRNSMYCVANPDQYLRNNIMIYQKLSNGKRTVFYLNHLDFREDAFGHVGGTQLHLKDLSLSLLEEQNSIVAARDREYLRVTVYADDEHFDFKYFIGECPGQAVFYHSLLDKLFTNLFKAFRVDLVHVHHTSTLSLDIFHVAHKLNIPIIATIHDFYYVCPTIKLLDADRHCCSETEVSEEQCDSCLTKQNKTAENTKLMQRWREENLKALSLCERLIFPSQSARDIFCGYYPGLEEKTCIIPHGMSLEDRDSEAVIADPVSTHMEYHFDRFLTARGERNLIYGWGVIPGIDSADCRYYLEISDGKTKKVYKTQPVLREDVSAAKGPEYLHSGFTAHVPQNRYWNENVRIRLIVENKGQYFISSDSQSNRIDKPRLDFKLRIAFVGGMVPEKGSALAKQIIEESNKNIGWYVFGTIMDPDLRSYEADNFIPVGPYDRVQLPELLRNYHIDAVCLLPILPETFCYTLSEAWVSGLPVIGTDIGAVGERIRATDCGWTVPLKNAAKAVLEIADSWLTDPGELETKKSLVEHMKLDSVDDMVAKYRALYASVPLRESDRDGANYRLIYKGYSEYREMDFMDMSLDSRIAFCDGSTGPNREEAARLRATLDGIRASRTYKFSRKLSRIVHHFRRK